MKINDLEIYKDLKSYRAICQRIERLDDEIAYLRQVNISDTVSGSESDYPFTKRTFKIKGSDRPTAERIGELRDHRSELRRKRLEIEVFINSISDIRTRQVFELRFYDGLSWGAVARRLGGHNSGDNARKIVANYLMKKYTHT